ncbi:hypothetical protein CKF54_05690 [Psittacicella hinzii]|uniref:Uncharacterized protein n=1 Tax=Psittacicella hinzii TaxID=2028575 RepID=A0A3A1Y407_9GAMM|nr:hypothetical protein [Psittacicella hinzii]RIY31986.1 hypothetical protein CKF54_05690 [Psittacicella hinzii]
MSANHLINLADDLVAGKITLEDIFQDQLVVDVLTLKDKDLDVEKDPEYYVDTPADLQIFANFDFTKKVMAEIANLDLEDTTTDINVEVANGKKLEADKEVKPLKLDNFNTYKNYNYGYQMPNKTSGVFYSESSNAPSSSPSTASNANFTVKTKDSSIFNLRNLIGATLAFIATFACIGIFSNFINKDQGFSTLAYSDPSMSQSLKSNNSGSLTINNNLASSNLASLSFKRYELDDPNLINYQPQLLTSVQLVSLHLVNQGQKTDGLLLSDKQSQNLSILIANYEIHKRLSSK